MATTAHAVPNLEVSAPDDMDLHSDGGLDFGDGDIELDLEPAPPVHRQDDDVSINDAASVGGLDVQTVPADQDDFMADHEDFIEEDYSYQDDNEMVPADHSSNNNTATTQIETLAPPDEDLIDYSDDEGQQPQEKQALSLEHDEFAGEGAQDEVLPVDQDNTRDTTKAFKSAGGETVEQHDQHSQDHDQIDHGTIDEEADLQGETNSHHDIHSEAHSEESDHTEDEDGGVQLQGGESLANDNEHEGSEDDVSQEEYDEANVAADNEQQNHKASDLQPITVNYAGNELWLFKEHDTDDSGDWLLEDISVAKLSMSDLFQACRLSLGDDVSTEHEIGFRFDHFHSLEVYEDNTACVAVSLERLVGLYHTLQAQDDNNEPECFYISLLFRPRFVTLLSDIAKYAEQGSGYSGLEAAVAAGDTHFNNVVSGSSTEHEPNEWDDEDEEGDHDDTEQTDSEAQQEAVQAEEHEEEPQTQASQEEHDRQDDDEHDKNGIHADNSFSQEQDHTDLTHNEASQNISSGATPSNQQEPVGQLGAQISPSQSEHVLESDARREQRNDDLIDYSDDEGPEDPKEVEHASVNAPSPSSSTVQGDEPTFVDDDTNTAAAPDHNAQSNENHDEVDFHAEDENDTQFNDQLLEGIDDTTQSYQNYDQAFDQNDPFQGFQTDGNADQTYAGFEYQTLDPQLQIDFLSGAEFNAGNNSTVAGNDFTGTDDFLDLNNAHEWATEQEEGSNIPEDVIVIHDDEEDGVAEHSAVAVSSTADPALASSTEFQKLSPQGQKRSIDEAGHGVDDALDSIDAKRPKV